MSRLSAELLRLYQPASLAEIDTDDAIGGGNATPWPPVDTEGRVRALVMELARPADWAHLGAVWRGVQAELDWPAPGIAVSGTDGLQLWFSLAEPLPMVPAHALLQALRERFMPDPPASRVSFFPGPDPSDPHAPMPGRRVPAVHAPTGNWSAFIAPDLAPVFADTPWLDMPPSPDGQAELLSRLRCITPEALANAQARLPAPSATPAAATAGIATPPTSPAPMATSTSHARPVAPAPLQGAPAPTDDPRAFLLRVMNDEAVDMALRIEAAKALLPILPSPARTGTDSDSDSRAS